MALVPAQNCKKFKVVVVGDSGTGKTALTYRYQRNIYAEKEATISADVTTKYVDVRGVIYGLQIWDTAGSERYKALTASYYRNADAIIFVYDVTRNDSFNSLMNNWVQDARVNCDDDPVRILVGNKCDQVEVVSRIRVELFANELKIPFFITSAKLDSESHTITSIFYQLTELLLEREKRFRREQIGYPYRNESGTRIVLDTTRNNNNSSGCSFFGCGS